jgi:predicted dehydrogenase
MAGSVPEGEMDMKRLGIGVVGCGNIASTYLRNAALFPGVELRACADMQPDAAQRRASEYGLRALSVDALLAADDVELVLNLTVPNAHFDISMAALSAGKHVFTEKPLAATAAEGRQLVAEARQRNLAIGSAPDTFLGAGGRLARRLMDDGAIGRVVAGTAFMMGRGMEHWHPNPQFYYQPGGGPVLDMGPYYITMLVNLLGPAKRVLALSTIGLAERQITAPGPNNGTSFAVGTPTTIMALIEFVSGASVTLGMSWDVFRHGNHPIELHGTEGSLRLPDPDTFGGTVFLSTRGEPWQELSTADALHGRINWPYDAPDRANYRMLGVADLARSLGDSTPPRASGELALHVLEVLEGILEAGASGSAVMLPESAVRPASLSEADAAALQTR